MSHCLIISFSFAQTPNVVSGKVVDENGNNIAIGDVLVYDAKQKNLMKYTQLINGSFAFDYVEEGNYYIKISALGYGDYGKELLLAKSGVALQIILKEDVTALEEVEITVSKNPITFKNGNLKVDVQNPIFSSIPDPLNVLSKLPNVQIAANRESITIIGKGNPLIYLGGQRINLEEFASLSVDNIDTIELINNPSSKYEADGRAVILVTRKRNLVENAKVNINETASFRRNFNNYLNANGNYSNGKWSLQSNLAYNDLGHWESNTFAFSIPKEDVFLDYLVLIPLNNRKQINWGLGFFHPLKKDGYLSINTTFRLQTDASPIETETFFKNREREDTILTETANNQTKDYFSGNFNYSKQIATKLNLFTGFQYSSFKQTLDTDISNNFNGIGFNLDQERNQTYQIGSLALRLDLEYNVSDKLKWEFGTNWNEAWADAFTKIQEISRSEENVIDFDYKERLYSGYTSLSGTLKKWLNYNGGVRIEYNQVKSDIENGDYHLVNRKNTYAFPRLNLNFKLDSTKTLSVNYARSISRPNFSRTSSISAYINPYLEGSSNVNLLPTLTNELTANFQWKGKSINASYFRNANPMYFTIRYDEIMDKAILSPVNLNNESGFNVGITLPFSYKKWTSTNTITLNYNKIEDKMATLGETNPYIYAYSNQQFRIGKDMMISFGGWLLSKRQEGIFKRNSMVVLDTSITKTFFKRFNCALRLNDITRGMNFEESYAINGVEAEGVYFADAKEIAFSIKYVLGNVKGVRFKNKDVDENLKRIR
ncbi:outer membrane beta-barrel family protein [Flagellimonas pacifica]|nr:outer membrane beta-barrel family protein [Allomuricauda parva]